MNETIYKDKFNNYFTYIQTSLNYSPLISKIRTRTPEKQQCSNKGKVTIELNSKPVSKTDSKIFHSKKRRKIFY